MLNNYLHDLATAAWLVSTALTAYLAAEVEKRESPELSRFLRQVSPRLLRGSLASLAMVLVFGAIRALAYRQYEYLPAAGRGQVTALVAKHVLLFTLVLVGVVWQVRLARRIVGLEKEEPSS